MPDRKSDDIAAAAIRGAAAQLRANAAQMGAARTDAPPEIPAGECARAFPGVVMQNRRLWGQ